MIRRVRGLLGAGVVVEKTNLTDNNLSKRWVGYFVKIFIGPWVINFDIHGKPTLGDTR